MNALLRAAFLSAAAFLSLACEAGEAVPAEGIPSSHGTEPRTVTVAVLDTLLEDTTVSQMQARLQKALPAGWTARVVTTLSADAVTGITRFAPDFVLGPADLGLQFRAAGEAEPFRVATRKTARARNAAESTGSLIVVRADRPDLRSLADLRGKRVAATLPSSLPGWLAAEGEIARSGADPREFWGEKRFLSFPFPDVVSAVLSGAVDAAVLPACFLETLDRDAEADTSGLRPIAEKTDDALSCRRSTALYPDISLWGFPWTEEKLVRAVTVGLLSAPPGKDGYEWLSAVPHGSVASLYRDLEIGPYSYLRDNSLPALYERYKAWVQAGALLILFLILWEIRLHRLVKKRTRELSVALAREKEAESESRRDRERLGSLERRNIVSQMSAMIAHEVKSPVAAICNFTAILDFVLPEEVRKGKTGKTVDTALQGIDTEAKRIAGIVDRVRNYAKSRQSAHAPCDLSDIARRAVKSLRNSLGQSVPVEERELVPAPVLGDSLELELLCFNLMKNGAEAVSGRKDAKVTISVTADEDPGRWLFTVRDNGPLLDDAAFAKLQSLMESVKPEGLGLGLSIVRGIADSHGALLAFRRNPTGGLTAELRIDRADTVPEEEKTK